MTGTTGTAVESSVLTLVERWAAWSVKNNSGRGWAVLLACLGIFVIAAGFAAYGMWVNYVCGGWLLASGLMHYERVGFRRLLDRRDREIAQLVREATLPNKPLQTDAAARRG